MRVRPFFEHTIRFSTLALCALGLAALYAILAKLLLPRSRMALLARGYAVLAVGFATLAVKRHMVCETATHGLLNQAAGR